MRFTVATESEEIGTVIDTLPDTDSFLPRYLTVQLLEILALTVGGPRPPNPEMAALLKKQEKFIESFKSQDQFTPLTFSIFWREDTNKILEKNLAIIDESDKYNRAPLTLAIANEDFVLATTLIKNHANLLLEDKLVLEIALISMIQRNPDVIAQILSAQDRYDMLWAQEYLEYLQSYISGEAPIKIPKYHEVLNPPLRHFGQILETLAYFNGLPSHYGFLSPSIEILAGHLELYTSELADPATKQLFTSITDAYNSTKNICQYYGNLPTVTDAAAKLSSQIVNNLKNNNQEVVVLFGGWAGNSVSLAFIGKTLIFSNLGIGGTPETGTKIFNINDPAAITEAMVNTFISGLGNATAPSEILALIGSIVDPKALYTIKQTFNPIDNCIFVNPRAIIQGVLLVLTAYQADSKITSASLEALAKANSEAFNNYVNSLYKYSTADLAKFMRNDELLQNRRVECCALAIDYINQHFKDPGGLQRCIELKNALEFVGLKDFYYNSVNPNAQAAIHKLIINEQEATAIKVIEMENAIAANQAKQSGS